MRKKSGELCDVNHSLTLAAGPCGQHPVHYGQVDSVLQKACQAKNQQESKIFRFIRSAKRGIRSSSRPDQRGARDRHERGTGSDGRGGALAKGAMPGEATLDAPKSDFGRRRLAKTGAAYGKDVWSRRPNVGVDGGNSIWLTGESAL